MKKLCDLQDAMLRHWSLCFLVSTRCLQDTMPCQWSSIDLPRMLRIWLSGIFYFTLLPAGFKASLVAGASPSKLARLYAYLWNIAPSQLFVWITTIHKIVWWSVLFKGYSWLANEESTFYGIRTHFTIGEHVRSLVLYPFGHRAMWFELN